MNLVSDIVAFFQFNSSTYKMDVMTYIIVYS